MSKHVGHLFGGDVFPNGPLFLADPNQLGVHGQHAVLQIHHRLSHRCGRKISLKKRADNLGIARGFLGHANAQGAQKLRYGRVGAAGLFHSRFQFAKLHLGEGDEEVILAWEIVEKSALAEVGSFGDVLDGGFGKAFLAELGERGAKEPFTDFGAATLTAIGGGNPDGGLWMAPWLRCGSHCDHHS